MSIVVSAVLLFAVAACETTPALVEMPPEVFAETIDRTKAEPNAVLAEQRLSELLDGGDLSAAQYQEALYTRAMTRWKNAFNKPGAMADLLNLSAQELAPRANEAATAISVLEAEILEHRGRLAGLQSLPNWFDDKVALGELTAAAARYQRSGLTPSASHTALLQAAGIVCPGGPGGPQTAPVHNYGDLPDHADGLVWCEDVPIT